MWPFDGVFLFRYSLFDLGYGRVCFCVAGNCIGEAGIKALNLAVGYQTSLSQLQNARPGSTGLMRLALSVSQPRSF